MPRDSPLALVLLAVLVGATVGGAFAVGVIAPAAPGTAPATDQPTDQPADRPTDGPDAAVAPEVTRFDSREAYSAYVRAGQRATERYHVTFQRGDPVAVRAEETADAAGPQAQGDAGGSAQASDGPSRVGSTNVQVAGLDEPDLVKAGEGTFYYSPVGPTHRPVREPGPVTDTAGSSMPAIEGETHVVGIADPAAPVDLGAIDEHGRLLRSGDTLVVLAGDHLQAYDVSDPADPTETWSHPLNASLVTARQRGDTLYLVTQTRATPRGPCPVEPLGGAASVACDDIYHPNRQLAVDSTYTALSLDAGTGEVADTVSFVGTARNAVVYVSADAIYVTYTEHTARGELLGDYALREADLPGHVTDRIREIRGYDISPASTTREIRRAIETFWESLPTTEAKEHRQAFQEGFAAYLADHQRDLVHTGVVRVAVDGTALDVAAVGEVPGRSLNQFSLSQYDGTLRLTTTVPAAGEAESENDLYVLDASSLDRRGAVQGMGLNERVYSVRYVDDTAYVVTFRRIDPFHVVDLSDPSDPTVAGKLKLPGFSSYLHPIDDDHVLGIGEEDGRVKAVLFDVGDPTNPTVADDLHLDAGWSAIAASHHAFTIDRKHGVFVLPAGDRAQIVDYTDGELAVETTVDTELGQPLRARYVDDYLYVFSRGGITVVDEPTWERETSLRFEQDR